MTERAKAFFINGGAGRVICSIPALEKYAEETSKDFIIVCEGGTDIYKGHPLLHERAYDHWHKNLFEDKLINMDLVSPEPIEFGSIIIKNVLSRKHTTLQLTIKVLGTYPNLQ